ncbi:MAG: hypothetical protein NVSMB17_18750 [Candidatus Dormibacteria bacterium]
MGLNHLPILLILAVVALIVFGPKRLPELGHGLGRAITEFKKGTSDLMASHETETRVEATTPVAAPVGAAPVAVPAAVIVANEPHPVAAPAAEPVAKS